MKLGYGGTKEEMARLLADASELAGKEFEMGNFADIIEAIHVIQENMGITGTTAEEASGTINGSILAWKSALDNLLTGIGRNENIDQLVDNLVDSTEDVIANLVPAIRRASEGFMQVMRVAVVKVGPQVMDAFRDIWNNKLPTMLTSAANGIIGLINDLFGTNIPKIETIELPSWGDISAKVILWAETVRNRIRAITKWTIGIFTAPTETATEMTTTFTRWWEETAKPTILSISTWALNLFGLPGADENTITSHVQRWWKGIVGWVQNACVWTLQLFGFAPDAAENAVLKVKQWFAGVIKTIGNALMVVFNWASGMDAADLQAEVETIYEDAKTLIGQALEFAWNLVPGPIQDKLQPLVDSISGFWTTNEETILGLIEGLTEVYNMISGVVVGMFSDALGDEELWSSLGSTLLSFVDAAKAIAEALAPVAEATFGTIIAAIKAVLYLIEPLLSAIKPILDALKPLLQGVADALVWLTETILGNNDKSLFGYSKKRIQSALKGDVVTADGTVVTIPEGVKDVEGQLHGQYWDDVIESGGDITPYSSDSPIGSISSVLGGARNREKFLADWEEENLKRDIVKIIEDYLASGDIGVVPEQYRPSFEAFIIPAIEAGSIGGGGGGGKPGASTEDVVTELETVKTELQGLRNDLLTAVQSLMNRPISIDGHIITQIISQGITRKARTSFG